MISCAVLAGGESKRMGTNKALIAFEGAPLVVRVAQGLTEISDDVFIVSKRPIGIDVPFREVIDEVPELTPLSGVITALYEAKHPTVFVCGCDMPFIANDLVTSLADRLGDADAIVPRHDNVIQSLHAVWSRDATSRVESLFADGQRAVHKILEGLTTRVIDVDDPRSFVSVDTPRQLAAIQPPPKQRPPSSWKLSGD